MVERSRGESSRGIACNIVLEAMRLLGKDERGGFQGSKLPGGRKRSALNHRNYVNAILDGVASARSRAYRKLRHARTALAKAANLKEVKAKAKRACEQVLIAKEIEERNTGQTGKGMFAKIK